MPELFVTDISGVITEFRGFCWAFNSGSAIFNILLIPAVMGVVVLVGSKARDTISQSCLARWNWLMAIQGFWFIDKGEFGVTHSFVLLSSYIAYLWRLLGANKTHETHSDERDIFMRREIHGFSNR